jgi:DNA-binding NarL/FixJ family response regulator
MTVRVMIAEDHPQVRSGLRLLIDAEEDLEVCCEASDGEEALRKARVYEPDLLLLDLSMPLKGGLEVARIIKDELPGTAILVLTMHEEEGYFYQLLEAGASGYVIKGAAPSDLLSAIRAVSRGGVVLHPSLAKGLVDRFRHQSSDGSAGEASGESKTAGPPLSPREREVLDLTAQGLTAREVATALDISSNTVERHRANIMAKLGFSNRAQLVRYAVESGLVKRPESGPSFETNKPENK